MASPFERLPADLLRPIFRLLRPKDLVAVSKACKGFSSTAQSLLYQNVTLYFSDDFLKDQNGFYEKLLEIDVDESAVSKALRMPKRLTPKKNRDIQQMKLWIRILHSAAAKEIRDLTVHYINLDYDKDDVTQSLYPLHLGLVLRSKIVPEKLTKLEFEYHWLPYGDIWNNVEELQVNITKDSLEYGPLTDKVKFPVLSKLRICWLGFAAGAEDTTYLHLNEFVGLVSCLVDRFRTIKSLAIDTANGVDHRSSGTQRSIDGIPKDFRNMAYKFKNTLSLDNLTEFKLKAIADTMYRQLGFPAVTSKGELPIVIFYHIFSCFVNRHSAQLKSLQWVGGIASPMKTEQQDPDVLHHCSDLKVFDFSVHQLFGPHHDIVWCNSMIGSEDRRASLTDLTLKADLSADNTYLAWVGKYVSVFQNLIKLRLYGLDTSLEEVHKRGSSGLSMDLLPWALGGDSEGGLENILPQSLQTLCVEIELFETTRGKLVGETSTKKLLDITRSGMQKLFQQLTSLSSVKLELNLVVTRPTVPDPIIRTLIARRRPFDYNDPYGEAKKVCTWSLGLGHAPSSGGLRQAPTHIVFDGYHEYNLALGVFKGPDGQKWQLDDEETSKIERCSVKGPGCCAGHLLILGDFWVSSPHE